MLYSLLTYLYKRFNWLSLDVVLGAVACHIMAVKLPNNHQAVAWPTVVALATAVWAIYLIDRQLDNNLGQPITDRHRFQYRYRRLIAKILWGLLAIGLATLYWLPKNIIWFGVGIAAVSAVYLLGVYFLYQKSWFESAKDLMVPVVYSIGVWGAAMVSQSQNGPEIKVLAVAFGLLTLQNLLQNAYFESFWVEEGDSLAIRWGEDTTRWILKIIFWLIIISCLIGIYVASTHYAVRVSIWLAAMATIQFLVGLWPQRWLVRYSYRYVCEAVFMLPLVI
jgi:4-hydroxybenzoate polyprenyltransferase